MNSQLNQSVQYIKSVGPKRAKSFEKIGIITIKDLLYYFPTKYLDRSTILTVSRLVPFIVNGYDGEGTLIGKVIDKELIRYGKKQILKVTMQDNTGLFDCVWFQGIKYFKNLFQNDEHYAISAKGVITKYGHLQFTHPDFDKLADKESKEFFNTGKIIPFYKLSKELRSSNIGELSLRRILNNAVEKYSGYLEESMPQNIIEDNKLLSITDAVENIHFPQNQDLLSASQKRFKYEEIFIIQILLAFRYKSIKEKIKGVSFKIDPKTIKNFLASLPFDLTNAQLKVLSEIRKDMESNHPMNRLLQGEVGSGKTVVAIITMLIAVNNGYQAAFMAPTEILATQHYYSFKNLLKNFNIEVDLLIGGLKKSVKDDNLKKLTEHKSNIIVGTHALLESNILFNNLGAVIIDEQHRFGVAQRSKLIFKGFSPDVLVMTATPIPRTLSMTIYGDLDISTIDEMPKNRKKIKTYIRSEKKLKDVYKFIVDKSKEGIQSFIVYPLVEESEKIDLKAAELYYKNLKSTYLKEIRVGLIHGKMKWNEKEKMMIKFASKELDVLISTTVIEVGIDVPGANIIVINDAFRFGLSQLHQLRGRVGRSDKQAYCILITDDAASINKKQLNFNFDYLSKKQIEKNKVSIRLNAIAKYDSGFKLAEIDLKLRGPGDIFGIKQSGFPELKYIDIIKDSKLLVKAKEDAFKIINDDPKLKNEKNKKIKSNLFNNYSETLKYSNIA